MLGKQLRCLNDAIQRIASDTPWRQPGVVHYGKEEYAYTSFEVYMTQLAELSSYGFLFVEVRGKDGVLYRVATTHFPVTKEGESTSYQLNMLPRFFEILDSHKEFVLCGDFNAPRGNETFRRIAARYQDCIPLTYTTSMDQQLHRVKGLLYMVDCLFVTPTYRATHVTLRDGVSDHMAIIATINPA